MSTANLVPQFNEALKRAITTAQMQRGLNQQMVGAIAGITKRRMSDLVRGRGVPTPFERKALAKALRTSQAVLFDKVAA